MIRCNIDFHLTQYCSFTKKCKLVVIHNIALFRQTGISLPPLCHPGRGDSTRETGPTLKHKSKAKQSIATLKARPRLPDCDAAHQRLVNGGGGGDVGWNNLGRREGEIYFWELLISKMVMRKMGATTRM